MKYVFFGTPVFARLVLEQLTAAGMRPEAVVCNPDRPAGRRRELKIPEAKKYVLENRLPIKIFQPENPSGIISELAVLRPDFFVVAAYGKILGKEILAIPRLGTVGVHSSLLPKYRGASPVHAAILAGERETGATIFMMDDKMDHGPVLAQLEVPILSRDTHETLSTKIWSGAGKVLAALTPDFLAGKVAPRPQDEAQATYTGKFTSEDGYVKPEDVEAALAGDAEKAAAIDRTVRAFGVEPGVWTWAGNLGEWAHASGAARTAKDKRVKILEAEVSGGRLVVKKIQVEGEKPKRL